MRHLLLIAALAVATFVACGPDPKVVASEEKARAAFMGLDRSIGKSLTLGFAGFNAASSANIPAQSTTGDDGGTLTITGQVDQGASANKGMRLKVGMVGYTDGVVAIDGGAPLAVIYDTSGTTTAQPALDLQLKNIPTGTWSGTLAGDFTMRGDLVGSVTLNLSMAGQLEDDGTGHVRRKAGVTTVTGTATSDAGVYQVNLTE